MFNKRQPHGEVHGTGAAGARYYQGGNYYDVDGRYVFSDPGATPPRGQQRKTLDQAEAEFKQRAEAHERGEAITETTGTSEPQGNGEGEGEGEGKKTPPLPEVQSEGQTLTPEQQLMQLNVPQLQALQMAAMQTEKPDASVQELRKQIIKGPGAKERLVAWLKEHTVQQ